MAIGDDFELGPKWTEQINSSMGPKTTPRVRQLISSLTRHLHDFARENELTVDEWMAAVNLINDAGKLSDAKRNEGQLLCDIIGLESLVDVITFKKAAEAPDPPTRSAILGPFWRQDTPNRPLYDTIVKTIPSDGQITFMHGRTIDAITKKPITSAIVDVWQASTNGLYEQQDDQQIEHNLRGKFTTDANGWYGFYCLKPTPYPIPYDGPAGTFLKLLDRHPMRPAHIHLLITHKDYAPLTTQIFDRDSPYVDDDSVFAVKDSLVVDFKPLKKEEEGGDGEASAKHKEQKASLELEYNVMLAPIGEMGKAAKETNGAVVNGNVSSV